MEMILAKSCAVWEGNEMIIHGRLLKVERCGNDVIPYYSLNTARVNKD